MSNPKCAICNKTAYPLESVTALDKAYHKGCFKCAVCNTILNLKNFKGVDGKIYCATHTPKPASTAVADSLAVKQALNAPKKTAEGLAKVSKTDVKAVGVGLDSVSTANAMKAPKKVAEGARGVQKGSGGKPQYAVFGAGEGGAPSAASQESGEAQTYEEAPAAEEQQYEEAPAAEEQQYEEAPAEEQQYEEAPAEEQQYEEQPAEEQQYAEEGQYAEGEYQEEQPAEEEQQW
uniref:Predicted protein n=1 Tax=Hordeum vulgare subsp. vulgare TaxID=112509 RepID=F2E4H4_HORVV|nr:predicted protein [Hordeum vulgare subsp. vulgare]